MKAVTAAFLCFALASSVQAAGWKTQYLTNAGEHDAVVSPKAEYQLVEAYVDSKDGWRFQVSCTRPQLEDNGPFRAMVGLARVDRRSPVWGRSVNLSVSFDGGPSETMSAATFSDGLYLGTIHGGIFAKLQDRHVMRIMRQGSGGFVEFTLENSINALDAMNCGRY
ncbi:MAG: hypothetical protein ACRCS0_06545 [Albidovulum sp.]